LERLLAAETRRTTQRQFAAAIAGWAEEAEEESVVRDVRRSVTQELQAESSGVPAAVDEQTNHTIPYEGPLRAPALPVHRNPEPIRPPKAVPPPIPSRGRDPAPLPPIPRAPAGSTPSMLPPAPLAQATSAATKPATSVAMKPATSSVAT